MSERSSPRAAARSSGTSASAAWVGVEQETAATSSISVRSTSWPTALITGRRRWATVRQRFSSQNAQRSVSEPPPRQTTATSTAGISASPRSARAIAPARAAVLDRGVGPDDRPAPAAALEPGEQVGAGGRGAGGDDADRLRDRGAAGAAPVSAHDHSRPHARFPARSTCPTGGPRRASRRRRGTTAYVGSLADGAIARVNLRTGTVSAARGRRAGPGHRRHRRPAGRHRIWAAGGATSEVRAYDARTGALLQTYHFTSGFLNDVVVTRHAVYVTDSNIQQLIVIPLGRHGALPGSVEGLHPAADRRHHLRGRLQRQRDRERPWLARHRPVEHGQVFRVNPVTGSTTEIDLGSADAAFGDGIEVRGSRLFVVQNQLNRVEVFKLGRHLGSARLLRTLTSPGLDVPTTLALRRAPHLGRERAVQRRRRRRRPVLAHPPALTPAHRRPPARGGRRIRRARSCALDPPRDKVWPDAGGRRCSRSSTSRSATAGASRSTARRSPRSRAGSSASSARTAPARPRRCAASSAWREPDRGEVRWHGRAGRPRRAAPLRVHARAARPVPADARRRAAQLLRPAARPVAAGTPTAARAAGSSGSGSRTAPKSKLEELSHGNQQRSSSRRRSSTTRSCSCSTSRSRASTRSASRR